MKKANEESHIVRLSVRLSPRSSRDAVTSFQNGIAHIHLNAPPVENAANISCCAFLADLFGISKSRVTVISGFKSRNKVVALEAISSEQIVKTLTDLCPPKE